MSKTVTITEKQNEETLKALINNQEWRSVDRPEDVIKFNDDGTGYVTFTDLITYEKVSAEFNWQFAEYSEEEGLLIAFSTKIADFDACFCILSLDGKILDIQFYQQNPEMWYFQYTGDFIIIE